MGGGHPGTRLDDDGDDGYDDLYSVVPRPPGANGHMRRRILDDVTVIEALRLFPRLRKLELTDSFISRQLLAAVGGGACAELESLVLDGSILEHELALEPVLRGCTQLHTLSLRASPLGRGVVHGETILDLMAHWCGGARRLQMCFVGSCDGVSQAARQRLQHALGSKCSLTFEPSACQ